MIWWLVATGHWSCFSHNLVARVASSQQVCLCAQCAEPNFLRVSNSSPHHWYSSNWNAGVQRGKCYAMHRNLHDGALVLPSNREGKCGVDHPCWWGPVLLPCRSVVLSDTQAPSLNRLLPTMQWPRRFKRPGYILQQLSFYHKRG